MREKVYCMGSEMHEIMSIYLFQTNTLQLMLNVTARLALKISNLPNWTIDWNDRTPSFSF